MLQMFNFWFIFYHSISNSQFDGKTRRIVVLLSGRELKKLFYNDRLRIIRKTLIRLFNHERVKFEDRSRLPRWLQLTLCPPRHFTGDVGWKREGGNGFNTTMFDPERAINISRWGIIVFVVLEFCLTVSRMGDPGANFPGTPSTIYAIHN